MAYAHPGLPHVPHPLTPLATSELNLFAMALGPGKHLKGLTLMNGLVTPEEVCSRHFLSSDAGGLMGKLPV